LINIKGMAADSV